jgi:aryl-alcohol dehydrogenase-like predicted oxidoreductase
MQTRQFGITNLQITPIGVGAWAMGGDSWGPQDDQKSIDAIKHALDLGINWIDTAAIYGKGHSEEVVGKAIKGREQPLIFTKCSLIWDEAGTVSNSMKARSIEREVEDSLRRLDIDAIDLYQIHWPNPDPEIEEGWSTLAKLKQEGKVRHIGVSNFSVAQMERAQKIAPVESLQPPYSLVHPDVQDEILPYCLQKNVGVIVYSPMMSGLLSGSMTRERIAAFPDNDWRRNSADFREPRLSRNLELANLLTEIGYPHNVPASIVSIAWTLQNPAVTAAIVGMRNSAQVDTILAAAEFRLTDSELAQINQFLQTNP